MSDERIDRNLGLDLVRATEAAALAAGRWMGLGNRDAADQAAAEAMFNALNTLQMDGVIALGEEARSGESGVLLSGAHVGTGHGPKLDVVVDPIDGRRMLAQGRPDAIAVAAVAPRGSMWSPKPAAYMEKLVVNSMVAAALVPECLDAPAAWTLALVARSKGKAVRDLLVFVLDRPRHADLIDEIRAAGARVVLQSDGDIAGALQAASPNGAVDVLMGIGGASEGVVAACAVKALGGAMLARLAREQKGEPSEQTKDEPRPILSGNELVAGQHIFFAATGITDGPLLKGVRYEGGRAETHSLILRAETGTRRLIQAEHVVAVER